MDFQKRLNSVIKIRVFNYINLCLSSGVSLNPAVKCLNHSGKGLGKGLLFFPKTKTTKQENWLLYLLNELQASVFSCFIPEFLVQ